MGVAVLENPTTSVLCSEPALPRACVTRWMVGMYHAQACAAADATDAEVLAVMRRDNPAGTDKGWVRVERDSARPCAENPDRVHLLVAC